MLRGGHSWKRVAPQKSDRTEWLTTYIGGPGEETVFQREGGSEGIKETHGSKLQRDHRKNKGMRESPKNEFYPPLQTLTVREEALRDGIKRRGGWQKDGAVKQTAVATWT